MFYLIGGAPRSGKTTIAKELSKKLNIPWISTDTLECIVMGYVENDKFDELFPKSVIRKLTLQSNDLMYSKYTSEHIVDVYVEQGKSLEQAIETFIENESKYNHDYVLEGYHITPSLVATLEQKFKIKSIFVGREDISKTLEAITKSSQPHDWVITKTKDEKTYLLIAEMLCDFSTRTKRQAEEYNLSYIEIGDNFNNEIDKVVNNF